MKNVPKKEPKQETIEEAAERLFPFTKDDLENMIVTIKILFWIDGAKWQAERSFSEEQVIELLEYVRTNFYDTGKHWHQEPDKDFTSKELFEQFKKK